MDFKYILALGSIIVSFIAGFSYFLFIYRKTSDKTSVFSRLNLVFTPFAVLTLIFFPLLYWLNPENDDFIFAVNFWSIALPPVIALAVFLLPLVPKLEKWGTLIALLGATACTALLPYDFLFFDGLLPLWLDRIVIVIFWTFFCSFYYLLNGLDGILGIENLTISLGLAALAVLGATPYLFGIMALCFSVLNISFMIFNWNPAKLSLDKNGCRAMGFMLAWLIFMNGVEGNITCSLIFAMYYLVEIAVAFAKKLSLREKYTTLIANTNYYQTNISGLSPCSVAAFLLKLQIVLIILGCFQIYAPNSFSIPILAFIISIWFLNRMVNWKTPKKTFKQLNKDLVKDIKKNIDTIKNLGKDE